MIEVNRKDLLAELSLLSPVAERKATIPILATVLCEFDGEHLQLTATNIDCTLLTSLEAAGDPWSGCVPLRQLYALTRLLEGDTLTLTPKSGNRLEVKYGPSRHLLPTRPATDFPSIDAAVDNSLTLDATLLTAMIQTVRFSILGDNGVVKTGDRKFTGLQVSLNDGKFKLEASRKVTFASAECVAEGENFTAIIPARAISALLSLADKDSVSIGVTENRATFRNGGRVLVVRLLEGVFPDFSNIIPEFKQAATVEVSALRAAIRRTLLTTVFDNRNRPESVRLTFTREELAVESRDGDLGKSDERVAIISNLNGEAAVFGVFGNQILDWLAVATERVKVEVNAPTLVRFSSVGEQRFKSQYMVSGAQLRW